MNLVWCEGKDEFRFFDESELRDFGGVRVHPVKTWHLINGIAIEMRSEHEPWLDRQGCPVVVLRDLSELASFQVAEALPALEVSAEQALESEATAEEP